MTAAGTIRIRASKIHAQTPLEINMYRSEAGSRERQKDISPKGTRSNPPTGGSDSGFTMNFAFDGLSKSGVLCGCEFIRYRPFLDAPEEIAPDDSAFDWGALVGNVIGGLTIVAAVTALAAYGATVVFTGGASAVFAPWVVGGLTAFCGGAFVFGQAEKDMEMKKVSKFSTYAGGSIVNSLKGAFAAAAFCMVPYAAEGMVYSVVPAATGGLSVGSMFISTDAMIALTGTVGYTITFSNMAVKASDSLEGVVGTNVMENMVGEEGYQKIAEASQSGSEIIFMMGLMNPDLYVKDQRVTNIRQVAAYDNSGGGTETELFLPDDFYNKNLPSQVTPGIRYLPKYDEFGNVKQIKMYDDYGREIGWIDYTNHGYGDINSPDYHAVPHWHERIYNAQNRDGMKINHRTDTNTPLGDEQ